MESVFSFLSTENVASLCLGIFVGLLGYFVIQYKRTYSFWSSRGVHGPPPIPFFGNYHLYMFRSIPKVDHELGKIYGRVYGVYEGTVPVLMVADPEMVEKIFITDHSSFKLQMESPSSDPLLANQIFFLRGEELKRVRGIITMALTTAKLRHFFQQLNFDDFNRFLQLNSGKEVNVSPLFNLHMLNVVSRHFYGLDLDLFNNPDHELVAAALGFGFNATQIFIMKNVPFLAPRMMKRIRRTNDYLSSFVSYAVEERLKQIMGSSGIRKEEKEKEKEENEKEEKETKEKEKPKKGRKKDLLQTMTDANFTDIQLKANLIAMTKAGFGTTQTTLCFFCFEMARNREVQKLVQREVDEVLKTVEREGRKLMYEDLNNFPLLDSSFTEVLRLHPVDFRTFRRTTMKTKIPSTEIEVPENQLVKVPLHSLHFDEELFDDPSTFKPERWFDELKRKKCSFMAFGAGPRMCPGSNFASLNAKLVMINILSRFTLELSPKTCVEIPAGHFAATPENVWVKLVPRGEKF